MKIKLKKNRINRARSIDFNGRRYHEVTSHGRTLKYRCAVDAAREDFERDRKRAQETPVEELSRWEVYNVLPHVPLVRRDATRWVRRHAGRLFDEFAHLLGKYKHQAKKEFTSNVLSCLNQAHWNNGVVSYGRDYNKPTQDTHPPHAIHISLTNCSRSELQVIDALAELGYIESFRSPPGSPKRSRIMPVAKLKPFLESDPDRFDPTDVDGEFFVELLERETKEPIDFDLDNLPVHHVAHFMQNGLEIINGTNAQWRFEYEPFLKWSNDFGTPKRLRPVHRAIFTDRWEWHGRLYTSGKYGHQSLRKIERKTITINGKPTVELDYSGMHPRMLYHANGIDYSRDPYALWGRKTTPPMRLIAKTLINTALNAKSRKETINACNAKLLFKNPKTGKLKSKQDRDKAENLLEAKRKTGLSFNRELYDLARRKHDPIAHCFGSDAGMQLMRADSSIAIDVMAQFAVSGIPILGVHDSFIVPARHEDRLRELMVGNYVRRFGFAPVVR